MKRKFSRTVDFAAPIDSMARQKEPKLAATWQTQPLDATKLNISGQAGNFIRLSTDLSFDPNDADDKLRRFQNEEHWSGEKREQVKKFRFVVCVLALMGLGFALMSRPTLNIAIVEMTKERAPPAELVEPPTSPPISSAGDVDTTNASNQVDETQAIVIPETVSSGDTEAIGGDQSADLVVAGEGEDDGLHFDWDQSKKNILLAAFYVGYMPGILICGSMAEMFGAKYLIFIAVFGSSILSVLTPMIARCGFMWLAASRFGLGLIQGGLLPSLYELFNRWLTATESSIFAPLIKSGIPFGLLAGSIMPAFLDFFGLEWPVLFYIGGFLCLVWSIVWYFLATSTPQANPFVEENEIKRIMRKKLAFKPDSTQLSTMQRDDNQSKQLEAADSDEVAKLKAGQAPTPWRLIATNPSVLALTLVKFTYNLGVDFIVLQLAIYLRDVHDASCTLISAISCFGYLIQMLLIVFVGWAAKEVIAKRTLGLSVTKWRKIFQGGSNFAMALVYVLWAYYGTNLYLVTCFVGLICFFWMLGAGGESMVPYDLSSKYPASIMSLAHSISILSGAAVPWLTNKVVGEDTKNNERWSLMMLYLSGLLTLGGLVFVLLLKSKPFLPDEVEEFRRKQEAEKCKRNNNNNNPTDITLNMKANGFAINTTQSR